MKIQGIFMLLLAFSLVINNYIVLTLKYDRSNETLMETKNQAISDMKIPWIFMKGEKCKKMQKST